MFTFNDNLFFFFLLAKTIHSINTKDQIHFSISNVPSLFRCEVNGPLFYFDHFPTNEEFHQTLKKTTHSCQFIFTSIDQHMMIELKRLELLCEIFAKRKHVNNFLFFLSKCSTDSCRRFLPSSVRVITEFSKEDRSIEQIDLISQQTSSDQIFIGKLTKSRVRRKIYFEERSSELLL